MNYKLNILIVLLAFLSCTSCSNDESNISVKILKWESSELMHTTYFYEVENRSPENLLVEIVIEATCDDGTVYSDEEWIEVSSHKTRKSSSFFSTDGKRPNTIEIVDIKSRMTFH